MMEMEVERRRGGGREGGRGGGREGGRGGGREGGRDGGRGEEEPLGSVRVSGWLWTRMS